MELVIEEQRGRERQLFETCPRNGVEFRWPEKEELDVWQYLNFICVVYEYNVSCEMKNIIE